MTDQEIRELPKVWVIGGDGALGDIGFQNVSKVILQNRPNVKMLMLDTQVYSNTGGQNSDSSTMLGGYDMNQFGVASQGKLIEKKSVAEAFTSGHGSPFVAQVSMANAAKLYKAILDGLEYRGTAFFQSYTTCQPEHAVGGQYVRRPGQDDSRWARHARIRVQPAQRRDLQEAFDLKGNPSTDRDWWQTKYKANDEDYSFTVAHWALTEGRFRKHVKTIKEDEARELTTLEDMFVLSRRTTWFIDACLIQTIAASFRISASTSKPISRARRVTSPSRAKWFSSQSNAAKPGACCKAAPGL